MRSSVLPPTPHPIRSIALASARALLQQQAGQPLQSLSLPGGGGGGEVPSPQQQQQHQEGEGGLPRGAADEPGPSAAAGEPHAAASGGGAAAGGTLVSASDLDPSEAVLRVQVCKPKGGVRASQEFLVLGSQRLTELRDRLVCTTDSVARVYLPDHVRCAAPGILTPPCSLPNLSERAGAARANLGPKPPHGSPPSIPCDSRRLGGSFSSRGRSTTT